MTTLYAATSNPGKLREFTRVARAAGFDVQPLPGLATLPPPAEDAATFMGNAELKATAYSRASTAMGLLVFADDSGLEVEALGGGPGVRSARFADDLGLASPTGQESGGTETKDERNNRAVLGLLAKLPPAGQADRRARFVCALALARDGHILLRAEGTVEGSLLASPRGAHGFGYDPLFLLPALGLTLAELDAERKWEWSHRGRAFRALLERMRGADFAQTLR